MANCPAPFCMAERPSIRFAKIRGPGARIWQDRQCWTTCYPAADAAEIRSTEGKARWGANGGSAALGGRCIVHRPQFRQLLPIADGGCNRIGIYGVSIAMQPIGGKRQLEYPANTLVRNERIGISPQGRQYQSPGNCRAAQRDGEIGSNAIGPERTPVRGTQREACRGAKEGNAAPRLAFSGDPPCGILPDARCAGKDGTPGTGMQRRTIAWWRHWVPSPSIHPFFLIY